MCKGTGAMKAHVHGKRPDVSQAEMQTHSTTVLSCCPPREDMLESGPLTPSPVTGIFPSDQDAYIVGVSHGWRLAKNHRDIRLKFSSFLFLWFLEK
jgi:hypothetical protein